MLICVDAGNSTIIYAIYKERELVCTFKTLTKETTSLKKMYDDFMLALSEYGLLVYDMEFAMIASVVDKLNPIFQEFCKKINIECYFIDSNSPLGLDNMFEENTVVEADVLVQAYQATKKSPVPLVIVDFGTTTTITLINEFKTIEGSVVFPGIGKAIKELNSNANMAYSLAFEFKDSILGKNSHDSLENGLLYGTMYAINGIISQIRDEHNYEYMNVIVTGGIGHYIYPFIDGATYDENLIIDGLCDIYQDIGKKLNLRTKDIKSM